MSEPDAAIPGLRSSFVETLQKEWRGEGHSYWLTRFVILRLLGAIYCIAFLVAARQIVPLVGSRGLSPVGLFFEQASSYFGSTTVAVLRYPSLFWLAHSDGVLLAGAWLGAGLSLAVALGYANAIGMALLWVLYLSFVKIGQHWYSFGWEIQLCETGFLAIFLCPLLDGRPFPRRAPPTPIIWLYRWLIFRIMLGAGLIKLRGDPCWVELTCLEHHYQTQPIPNPLSRSLHFAPAWFHKLGVLFNHLVELVAPWFVFGPARGPQIAGGLMLVFQLMLIVSGNLSFLNWLTLVPVLACFDDSVLRRVLPRRLTQRAERAKLEALPSVGQRRTIAAAFGVVVLLSIFPAVNLISPQQAMNQSFNPLALVNTYGAFGNVTQERREIVLEGTSDAELGPQTVWRAYEFKCKPGDPLRRPCLVSPYHLRLDWMIWFAAMDEADQHPWLVHLIWKLLEGDRGALGLLEKNPFEQAPPKWVRAELYRYEFVPASDPSGAWWKRTRLGTWLRPLSRDDPELLGFLARRRWIDQPAE